MRIIDNERGVPTTNLKRCTNFYTEVLGFKKVSESRDRCTVALGSDQVVFRKAHKKEVQSLREIGFSLSFRISGIHGYYEQVRATGKAKVTFELDLMQPGVWQFVIVDCNGYSVGFAM